MSKKATHEEIEQAKALLKENGYQVDNLWTVDDVKSRFNCTDEEAHHVMYKALTNDATMEQIWLAIDIVGEIEGLTPIGGEDRSEEIFEQLKSEYVDSDVTSGEFYSQVEISMDYTEDEVREGIQMFLDWDESEAEFELEEGEEFWNIIDL